MAEQMGRGSENSRLEPGLRSGLRREIFRTDFLLGEARKKCLPSFPNKAKYIPHAEVVELVDTLS
ncbi:hypothetical protein [Desulfovibrio sp.]|uniref:hypothetical protein n=1 Tax=Desulfovibrio sp. TaxID=885 RepID=UPI0023C1A389|nr:hypothetical protein [Desulfovibrio sp.]MDE7241622.1 hypothetical protein [Desulfovibrio sp.]